MKPRYKVKAPILDTFSTVSLKPDTVNDKFLLSRYYKDNRQYVGLFDKIIFYVKANISFDRQI